MPPIRVVTAELPRILRCIIEAVLADETDIEMVGRTVTRHDLRRLVGGRRVDVVILGIDDETLPEFGKELLQEDPFVTVLAVVAEGQDAFLYHLRPTCTPMGAISPQGLAAAIRETARGRDDEWMRR